MKWIFCFFCWFSFLPEGFAQDEFEKINGIGVVVVSLESPVMLEFYEETNASAPHRQVKLLEEPGKLLNDSDRQWLNSHRALSHEISFICLALKDNHYQVVVNKETSETLWLRNKTFLHLLPWNSYLQQSFPLRRLDVNGNRLLSRPTEGAPAIAIKGRDCLRVLKTSGDWMQVEVLSACSRNGKAEAIGWIKWRDERDLLVGY
ncbi:MAG: hypothetical protein WD077_02870 [Bacteroidia bacterium]